MEIIKVIRNKEGMRIAEIIKNAESKFELWKIESTPSDRRHRLEIYGTLDKAEKAAQELCPNCGSENIRPFEGLSSDRGSELSPDQTKKFRNNECSDCGHVFPKKE